MKCAKINIFTPFLLKKEMKKQTGSELYLYLL
jgi:hypothetical protein